MNEHWIVDGKDGPAWLLFDENALEHGAPFVKVYGAKEAAEDIAKRLNAGQPGAKSKPTARTFPSKQQIDETPEGGALPE